VCDNDEYFFKHIDEKILPEMGAPTSISSRQFLQVTNAQGTGYARSTKRELEFITSVSRKTGILMDPVYSGKALFHLIRELNENPVVRGVAMPSESTTTPANVLCCAEIRGQIDPVCAHGRSVRTL
jgi:1-aminocyclopropane-1-carboxylate deaminase/D-cysteine desulfhydrase-like pyridoxal-dependent ACC family enzyme